MSMNDDTSKTYPQQKHIEEALSKPESPATIIFRRITNACNDASLKDPKSGFLLARDERNTLRGQVLFILKYQASQMSNFRRTLDKWSRALEEIRQRNRVLLTKAQLQLPTPILDIFGAKSTDTPSF